MPIAAFTKHDHHRCIQSALRAADALCATRKARLTPIRRRVLEILLEEHKAMGAYDVLERLRAEGLADTPPIAYRALNFLVEHGFVHRIEKLNAFLACDDPKQPHQPMFFICTSCQQVAEEQSNLLENLGETLDDTGAFEITAMVIEAEGQCHKCQKGA